MKITSEVLEGMGACGEGVARFQKSHPDGIDLSGRSEIRDILADDWSWFLSDLCEIHLVSDEKRHRHDLYKGYFKLSGGDRINAYYSVVHLLGKHWESIDVQMSRLTVSTHVSHGLITCSRVTLNSSASSLENVQISESKVKGYGRLVRCTLRNVDLSNFRGELVDPRM